MNYIGVLVCCLECYSFIIVQKTGPSISYISPHTTRKIFIYLLTDLFTAKQ